MEQYLLGRLSEADQEQVENLYMADPDALEELEIVENELIDRYVLGHLSRSDRRDFERAYLTTPPRSRKVRFAQTFLERAGALRNPPVKWQLRRLLLAVAAVLVLVIAATFMLARRVSPVEVARESATVPERAPAPAAEKQPPRILAFALAPGLVRGTSQRLLSVPADVNELQLELLIESPEPGPYQARLATAEGAEVWRAEFRLDSGNAVLDVNLPARVLANQDYVLTVARPNGREGFEDVADYFFRVKRQ